MSLNPLDHPILLDFPKRYPYPVTAWAGHAPLAMLLMDLLRPKTFVELGTHSGLSYCSFCQAVVRLGIDCSCYAVDTWQGDPHALEADDGYVYDDSVLTDLRAYHDPLYSSFSHLLQMRFDEACPRFQDGSVDLLHIDGYHTYDAVRHDFETWLPKMSTRGVVLFHDIAEHHADFGVWRFWEELEARYPVHLSFSHSHGLGVVAVGDEIPPQAMELFALQGQALAAFRLLAQELGQRINDRHEAVANESETQRSQERVRQLESQVVALESALTLSREDKARYAALLADQDEQIEQVRATKTRLESQLAALEAVYADINRQLYGLESSRGVKTIKLARAARTVLRRKGPAKLAKHMALYAMGKRGYGLRDIQGSASPSPRDDTYHQWFLRHRAQPDELNQQREQSKQFGYRPLMSFVVPVYNPEPGVLRDTIESVLAQTYSNWELCLVDGASTQPGVHATLRSYAKKDARIHVTWLPENKGISGNSNAAVAQAHGEFVALLDHDDLVEPDLLFRVVEALNVNPDADLLYFDEDRASAAGDFFEQPFFKPKWSPETLLSVPFPVHGVVRRQLLVDTGGFDSAMDGTQDWDLYLRLSERTSNCVHIPHVLYHWRMIAGSAAGNPDAKPYVYERQLAAIGGHMSRVTGRDAAARWHAPGCPRVTWAPEPTFVSIIIPTKDKVALLRRCVDSILRRTRYDAFEIVLVDTGSEEEATRIYYASLAQNSRITLVEYEGDFNYSRACNVGAKAARGDSLLFMNNDMEALEGDWLEELVRWSNLPDIGVVGAKLIYPDRTIQHAGIVVGAGGVAAHIYYGEDESAISMLGRVNWYRNYSAVTGALHMMRRDVYDAVGGYDEAYDISYSDVALCYRVVNLGYRVLYDPFVRIIHYESQSRDRTPSLHDTWLAAAELLPTIESGDPYFSPHLSYQGAMPQLVQVGEPHPVQLLERLIDSPVESLKTPVEAVSQRVR